MKRHLTPLQRFLKPMLRIAGTANAVPAKEIGSVLGVPLVTIALCAVASAQPQPVPAKGPLPTPGQTQQQDDGPVEGDERLLAPLHPELKKMVAGRAPLNPEQTIFLDLPQKKVLLHTEIACNDCILEMFCCLERTKEHESILWLRGKSTAVHAALLALGIEPGSPVEYQPKFKQATGPQIDIFVNWVDEDGKKQRCTAQKWMRTAINRYYVEKLDSPPPGLKLPYMELRYDPFNKEVLWFGHMSKEEKEKLLTKWDNKQYQKAIEKFYTESQPKEMKARFVFGGSYEFVPEGLKKKVYAADGGQLICVANFAAATIDVSEVSSADDGGQSYEAWQERIPPRGTPVIMELIPRREKSKPTKPTDGSTEEASEEKSKEQDAQKDDA